MVRNQNFGFSKNRQKSWQIFGNFGQKNCRQKPPKIAKMAANCHIWSPCCYYSKNENPIALHFQIQFRKVYTTWISNLQGKFKEIHDTIIKKVHQFKPYYAFTTHLGKTYLIRIWVDSIILCKMLQDKTLRTLTQFPRLA